MATYRARIEGRPIHYIHADAEHTGLPSDSVDVVTVSYMFHEVPTDATNRILRVAPHLRPGGVILICDLDGHQVRDNFVVSSFRKWAFEVTEPHVYQYVIPCPCPLCLPSIVSIYFLYSLSLSITLIV